MPDPLGGLVSGLLAQIVGELASDLVESMSRDPRGAGLVDRPVRLDRRRPGPLRPRRLGSSEIDRLVTGLSRRSPGPGGRRRTPCPITSGPARWRPSGTPCADRLPSMPRWW